MKKKILFIFAAALIVASFFVMSVFADELENPEDEEIVIENSNYYIVGTGVNGGSPYLIYSNIEAYEVDNLDFSLDDFITILYGDDFEKSVESVQDRYENNENGVKDQFDSFEDYFLSGFGNQSERFKRNVKKQVELILKAKASEDNDQGGGNDDGSSGGNEGDDGSSSSGSQNGEPNVLIDPTVDTSHWQDCLCGSFLETQCEIGRAHV